MKLGDFIDIKHGFAFKGEYISVRDNNVVLVTPGNFSIGGGFKEDKCKFYSGNYSNDYVLREGDLIITMTDLSKQIDTLGYGALIPSSKRIYLHNQRIGLVSIKKNLNKKFLYWFLRSPKYQKEIANTSTGSTVHHTSPSRICDVEFNPPSLDNQNRIANVLNCIEEKINLNCSINKNLELQVRAVFSHLFAGNESVTPATIADISLNVTDGVHNTVNDDPEGEYLLLSCKNIKGGALSIGANDRRINSETFVKLRRRTKLAKGDVLISSVGTVGELLLLNTEPSNYEFQRSVAIIKPNPEIVSPAYLYEALIYKKAELINAAHGAVQQCLFISDIASFPIGIPTSKDLHKFDDIVIPMFDKITANEEETIRLTALRDTLLTRLMSGEIDVSKLEI